MTKLAQTPLAPCALGLTSETLSAWRAQGLDAAAAVRVGAHVPACPACQRHLAAYEAVDGALRRHDLPAHAASVTAIPRAVPSYDGRPGAGWRRRGAQVSRGRRPIWAGLSAAAAILAVVAGYAALFGRAPGNRTGRTSGQVEWSKVALPPGVTYNPPASWLWVAPGAGNIAYTCTAFPSTPTVAPQVWVTHDQGQHWMRRTDLPMIGKADSCLVHIDALDPQIVVTSAFYAPQQSANGRVPVPPSEQWDSFATFDGGTTWQRIPNPGGYVIRVGWGLNNLATWHGRTYAVRDVQAPASSSSSAAAEDSMRDRLFVSTDQMHTWTEIDQPIFAAMAALDARDGVKANPIAGIEQLWVVPDTGELLVEAWPGVLWTSLDGGRHWHQLAVPRFAALPVGTPAATHPHAGALDPTIHGAFYVEPPVAGQSVHLCGVSQGQGAIPAGGSGPNSVLVPWICSADGGKTWVRRPQMYMPTGCAASCSPGERYRVLMPIALAADGTTIALADDTIGLSLYSLPASASSERDWRYLGHLPRNFGEVPDVAPLAHGLALWVASPDGGVYTATYPAAS